MVANAVKEGVYNNEFPSGKYKLGGDWVMRLYEFFDSTPE